MNIPVRTTPVIVTIIFFFYSLTNATHSAHASDTCHPWAAKVQSFQGTVESKTLAQQQSQEKWEIVFLGQMLCSGDSIRLAPKSRASIRLANDTILRLDENSELVLSSVSIDKPSWINLLKGIVHFISRTPESLEIKTPFVNAAIDGTEFVVSISETDTQVTVFDGQVTVSNSSGKLTLKNNESAIATSGIAPQAKTLLKPRSEVQWALHYPPVIDYQSSFINEIEINNIINSLLINNVSSAFSQLESLSQSYNLADRKVLEATLLLSVGRGEKAKRVLDEALVALPNMSSAFALKSIIELTHGNTGLAEEFAARSALLSPNSGIAKVALSYVSQAKFDLNKAKELALEASRLSPENPFIQTRLSELYLSHDELDLALIAANKSVKLAPNYAHTHVTLGFAHLYQFDSTNAYENFSRALTLNPSSPLANLGLGLSEIIKGNLNKGTKTLESAAIMDPDNALLRSYLGKAYFQQNRFELAEAEFNIAKQLDRNDPTAFLYSAILYNAKNSPVLALENLQHSIGLNDNLAVFRSRLLLDRDLSSRNANLFIIYSDLGLNRRAFIESWKAVNIDPLNFSSHRFLGDVYNQQPRYEIASVSEYLQSQLLQPINVISIQGALPTASIPGNHIYTASAISPGGSLLTSNGTHSRFSALTASNNTYYIDANVHGINDKFSYSFNHRDYSNDGFQENDSFTQYQQDFFVQLAINHRFGFQFEHLNEKLEYGDVPYRINDFHQNNIQNIAEKTENRLGLNYKLSNKHTIIGSLISTRLSKNTKNTNPISGLPPGVNAEEQESTSDKRNGESFEVQSRSTFAKQKLILGAGSVKFDIDRTENTVAIINDMEFQKPGWPITTNNSPDYLNAYLYNYQNINYSANSNLTITTGLSFDQYRPSSSTKTKERINPKIGFSWTPVKSMIVRAAAFRTLKRTIIANKTIEPTQISGFNQFYDDNDGSASELYGVGADYNNGHAFFIGVEGSKREINQTKFVNNSASSFIREESYIQAYAYWIFNRYISLNAEIIKQEIDQEIFSESPSLTDPNTIDTLSVPLTLKVNSNRFFSIKFIATYVDQSVIFGNSNTINPTLRDRFPVFDVEAELKTLKRNQVLLINIRNIMNEKMIYQSNYDIATPRASVYTPETTLSVNIKLYF